MKGYKQKDYLFNSYRKIAPNLYGLNPIGVWFPTKTYDAKFNINPFHEISNFNFRVRAYDIFVSKTLRFHGKGK